MTTAISSEELQNYIRDQWDFVRQVYGECNEENLRAFARSDDSRKFREKYYSRRKNLSLF